MRNSLFLDFETRSHCDLRIAGVYNYAQDITTNVLCMSYAFNDEPVRTWTPDKPFPDKVRQHKGLIFAHNATFERLIFWYVLNINFAIEQFYCTATVARANCAPASLEDAGRFAGAGMRKDTRGTYLVRALSMPRADGSFNNDSTLMDEMIAYCEQDVRSMRDFLSTMRPLSEEELQDYHINEYINDRGVKIDVRLARAATVYAEQEIKEVQDLVIKLTHGEIRSVRSPKMREWVQARVGKQALELMRVTKDNEEKYSIDKSVRSDLLELADRDALEVPPIVADVIQCADDLWASSVAKFQRMINLADIEDDRVRGSLVFNGGIATGRASSFGLQVHNFTRMSAKNPDEVRDDMVQGLSIVPKHGSRVTDVLKKMLRPAIVPSKGKVFVIGDWSSIEARVTPWLSNDPLAKNLLDVFAQNKDVYVHEASKIFKAPESAIDKEMRQLGKIAILSCGFAAGLGAFEAMARTYKMDISERDAKRIIDAWRASNQWAVRFWSDIEEAYTKAMYNPNVPQIAGRIWYMYNGLHLWYELPSGRILCYPYARIDNGELTYAKASWKPASTDTEWGRARLWRGLATENVTQAVANDILRHALKELHRLGVDVVLHVHDEIVIECEEEDSNMVEQILHNVMTTNPIWSMGLPLGAETFVASRYGKG